MNWATGDAGPDAEAKRIAEEEAKKRVDAYPPGQQGLHDWATAAVSRYADVIPLALVSSSFPADVSLRAELGAAAGRFELSREQVWKIIQNYYDRSDVHFRATAGADASASMRAPEPAQLALQTQTAEDVATEQTVLQLALRIWASLIAQKVLNGMSALMDELLTSPLLDDDDEEGNDESWLVDHHKREKKLLGEAIEDGLDTYPTINAINNLPPNSDANIAQDVGQLKDALLKCRIGATKFEEKFSRTQLERMIKLDLAKRFKNDPKYSEHIREDVPGSNITKYGKRRRTSSKGTFAKVAEYENGGGLAALLSNGWERVAKDRLDPVAWSHQFGFQRKTERQSWRHHFVITERNGKQSPFELPRERLAGTGAPAIRLLMKAGVHVVGPAEKALVWFLGFMPKHEIIRMPQVGFFAIDEHYINVRSNEVLLPPALRKLNDVTYVADNARDPDQYGHQIKGTTKIWQETVAIPLRGNSNVALALATSFASALIPFAHEQRGGVHLFGSTGIAKTLVLTVGESVYGLPGASEHPRAYGRSWGITSTGLEDLLRFRNHAGLFLDELQRVPHENRGLVVQMIYAFTQVQKARGGSWRLHGDGAGQVFLLSAGEDPLAPFIGKAADREGRERRVPDFPAEVRPGSAFETFDHVTLLEKAPAFYLAMLECHGAPGRDWQIWLVELGATKIRARIDHERQAFLALPQVQDIMQRARPQLRSIVRRFALYAASLHMAIDAGILPWSGAEADAGLIACLERWLAQRGNTDPAIARSRFLANFLRQLADDLANRFIHIHKVKGRLVPATDFDAAKQQEPADAYDGFVKDGLVLIRPEAWVKRCAGAEPVGIAQQLHEQGVLLVSEKDGKFSKTEQTIGGSGRFYVVRRTALELADTSDTSDPEK